MFDPNAHTWKEPRIRSEIEALLPKGWSFSFTRDKASGYSEVVFSKGPEELWRGSDPFAQMVLLNAYGWLITESRPRNAQGPWSPRREFTLTQVNTDSLRRAQVPDPEDLDPEGLAAVYAANKK